MISLRRQLEFLAWRAVPGTTSVKPREEDEPNGYHPCAE